MSLQVKLEEIPVTVEYCQEKDGKIHFLVHVTDYNNFKQVQSVLETYVVDNSLQCVCGLSYSGNLVKGTLS